MLVNYDLHLLQVKMSLLKPLLLFSFVLITSTKGEFRLQILHNNDMHAQFEETNVHSGPCLADQKIRRECFGGFARTKAAINMGLQEAKSLRIPSLVLNGGDSFRGTPYYTMKKWQIVKTLTDALKFDVMTLGNHEFDDGIENVANFIKHTRTPIVCCNLDLATEPRLRLPKLEPSIVLTIEGTKVGVIGFVTLETMEISQTENLIIRDEIQCAQAEASRLKRSGVNIIIALSHSGFDRDVEIAKAIPELSLIVGAHSHTLLYSPTDAPPSIEPARETYPYNVRQKSGKVVPIVQAYAFTKYLGKLMVVFDDDGSVISASGNPQLLDSSVLEDKEMKDLVESVLEPLRTSVKATVAYARFPLRQANFDEREFESNMGNLVTDALVDYAVQRAIKIRYDGWTTASIAMVNKVSVRDALGNRGLGRITFEDIMAALPFGTLIHEVIYPAWAIKFALEYSLVNIPGEYNFPNWLYISGLRVVYDLSKPAYHRVESIEVLCVKCPVPRFEKLNYNRVYTILIPGFLFHGNNGFTMFKMMALNAVNLDLRHMDVVLPYVARLKWVYTPLDGRVIVKNKDALTSDKLRGQQ